MRDSYGLDRDALDRHITDSRYSSAQVNFECQSCGHDWDGTVESEYGREEWSPHDACPSCGNDDTDTIVYAEAGPPEEEYDPMVEQDRRERDREFGNGDFQEEER